MCPVEQLPMARPLVGIEEEEAAARVLRSGWLMQGPEVLALEALARRRAVALVEDAACAAGSELLWEGAWQRIGRPHGDAACFSFHPRKLITTGDGGIVTTRDALVDERVRAWRNHGTRDGV